MTESTDALGPSHPIPHRMPPELAAEVRAASLKLADQYEIKHRFVPALTFKTFITERIQAYIAAVKTAHAPETVERRDAKPDDDQPPYEPPLEKEDPIGWLLVGWEFATEGVVAGTAEVVIDHLEDNPTAVDSVIDYTTTTVESEQNSSPIGGDDGGDGGTSSSGDGDGDDGGTSSAGDGDGDDGGTSSSGDGDGDDGGTSGDGGEGSDGGEGGDDGEGGGCFVAGTPVHLGSGVLSDIDALAVQDTVASIHVEEGIEAGGQIIKVFRSESGQIVTLHIGGEAIACTPRHRFFASGGWVAAGELAVGAPVRCVDGVNRTVTSVRIDETRVPVFNLRVEPGRTYFVGNAGFLVHNAKKQPGPEPGGDDGEGDGSLSG